MAVEPGIAAVVCDIGGTHIRLGVGTRDGRLTAVEKAKVDSVLSGATVDEVWQGIHRRVAQYIGSATHLVSQSTPIVISFPGAVSADGAILSAPTLVGSSTHLPDLRSLWGGDRPVHILNDLSAAAWHYRRRQPGRAMVVTVSSGIGSKMFDRSHPAGVFDTPPFAGEIGHALVDRSPDAPLCDCGERGHLGAIASGRGIERAARRRAQRHPEAFQRSACCVRFDGTAEHLTNEGHLVPAALAGDEWAIAVIRASTQPLASILATVFLAAGLTGITVIGGFAVAFPQLYQALLRQEFSRALTYAPAGPDAAERLVVDAAGGDACLAGCLAYVLDRIGSRS